jgi:putative endopeptidase
LRFGLRAAALALVAASTLIGTALLRRPEAPAASLAGDVARARPGPGAADDWWSGGTGPGVDGAAVDPRQDPCDDFYRFACGSWLRALRLEPAQTAITRGFSTAKAEVRAAMEELIRAAVAGRPPPGMTDARRIRRLYVACMDEGQRGRALPALAPLAASIVGSFARDRFEAIGRLHRRGLWGLFQLSAQPDPGAGRTIGVLTPGALVLGAPGAYAGAEAPFRERRQRYRAALARAFEGLGLPAAGAAARASGALALEIRLAALAQVAAAPGRQAAAAAIRRGTRGDVAGFDRAGYLRGLGRPQLDGSLTIADPRYFAALAEAIGAAGQEELEGVFLARLVLAALPAAPADLAAAFAEISEGLAERAGGSGPRSSLCMSHVEEVFDVSLGRAFVARHLDPAAVALAREIFAGIRAVLVEAVLADPALTAAEKHTAAERLRRLRGELGHPPHWRSPPPEGPARDGFAPSLLARAETLASRRLDALTPGAAPPSWSLLPQAVSAWYQPDRHAIVVPAGMLRPPFVDPDAPLAFNYGALGGIIGHEIVHALEAGRPPRPLVDEACVRRQFERLWQDRNPLRFPASTLSENAADLGGLAASWAAMRMAGAGAGGAPEARRTAARQLSLGWAQLWCAKMRSDATEDFLLQHPYPPGEFRVNGPLSNLSSFAEAFSCRAEQAMVSRDRCRAL